MWGPRRLTSLWASAAWFTDSFTYRTPLVSWGWICSLTPRVRYGCVLIQRGALGKEGSCSRLKSFTFGSRRGGLLSPKTFLTKDKLSSPVAMETDTGLCCCLTVRLVMNNSTNCLVCLCVRACLCSAQTLTWRLYTTPVWKLRFLIKDDPHNLKGYVTRSDWIGFEDWRWRELAQVRIQWRASEVAVFKFRVHLRGSAHWVS
jgi:hypothetical protein